MRRELAAAALLIALLALSLVNLQRLDALIDGIAEHVELSAAEAEAGRSDSAARELDEAAELWLGARGYTHIFIRHSEIDALSDELFELRSELARGETVSRECYLKLLYHLESIERMDHLHLGSIF